MSRQQPEPGPPHAVNHAPLKSAALGYNRHDVTWVWLFLSEALLVLVRLGGEEASVPYVPGV
jgi:hypothetical protein